jgi:hypothetical protein
MIQACENEGYRRTDEALELPKGRLLVMRHRRISFSLLDQSTFRLFHSVKKLLKARRAPQQKCHWRRKGNE